MSTKHTPGPWHIIEDRTPGSLEVFAGNVAVCECWRRSDVQTEIANANLIAAAPELLSALKQMVHAFLDVDGCHGQIETDAMDSARAAIAKATGGGK